MLSRKAAILKLTNIVELRLNVNGIAVVMGKVAKIVNSTKVEFNNPRFVFLVKTGQNSVGGGPALVHDD